MKMIRKITTLLLTLTMMLLMGQAAFAQDIPVNGGTYTYSGGDEIVASDIQSLPAALSAMEPGDSMTITQTYVNESDNVTEWYLKNDVIKSLENESEASGGGYTYILTAGGEEIFNSDRVGGTGSPSEDEKGLQLATDATDEYIHIDRLASGEQGTTTLYVALDGESQANIYQTTDAQLELQYAVEEQAPGEDVIKHVPGKSVNTGDTTNIILPVIAFLGALLLLIFAVLSYKKDKRKDGEEA